MDTRELGVDVGEVDEIARQNPRQLAAEQRARREESDAVQREHKIEQEEQQKEEQEKGHKHLTFCESISVFVFHFHYYCHCIFRRRCSTALIRMADAEHPPAAADAAAVVDNFETRTRRFFDMIYDGDIQQLRVLIDALDADELNILLRWMVDPVQRDYTRSRSALWSAFFRQHIDIVDLLLEKGADPNEPVVGRENDTNTNMTPLFIAVLHAHLPLCRVLVDRGANVDLGSDFATTPLMIACKRSQMEIVSFLIENGADINLQNGDGETALMATCNRGNVDIVRLLLSHGANVEQTDYTGFRFALKNAANEGHLEVCRLLVEEWAADINQQTILERSTALICAASLGHLAIVDFLIEHGADLQHADVAGLNALMWAVISRKTEMARHLVAIGADINQRDAAGRRAQDFAEERGNAEMVAIFRTPATDNGRHAEGTDGQQNDQQQM
ncbi:hypothetical protein niasHT_000074 [Heterodera trifolii]|uniref:Ankyrin repeat protein n=1 Tax=Heterodera trifolii TaxID=157864 RepID=A0ABD2M4U1_9BILA